MATRIGLAFRIGLTFVILASPALAQTARPSSDTQTISRGWAALAAGRLTEAASIADGMLKRKPRSHAALSLKIEALAAGSQPISALDAYEAWLPKAGRSVDDRGLLQPVAVGLLRVLAADPDGGVRSAALRRLADDGDDAALEALRKSSAEGDQRSAIALADRGDPQAISSLQTLVSAPTGRDVSAAIDSLAARGGISPGLLETLLKDRVPMNRAAAVRALARSNSPSAAQQLDSMAQDPDRLVRTMVILARARSGDERALSDARAMLTSEVADIRLIAAEGLGDSIPREVDQAVRPLLANPDGIYRFRAAAIVGRTDPAAVQSVLIQGLADQNPLVQQEASRIATETLPDDIVLLRQLLRHRDHAVVVNAAAAILGN